MSKSKTVRRSKTKAGGIGRTNIKFWYPVSVKKDSQGFYMASFPNFPEAVTDGATRIEALQESIDCLAEAIAGRINRGDDIPQSARQTRVPVPAQMAIKAGLYLAMRESKIKNTELAKKMEVDEKEVRRLLDPYHSSKLPRIEAAMKALGKHIMVEVAAQ